MKIDCHYDGATHLKNPSNLLGVGTKINVSEGFLIRRAAIPHRFKTKDYTNNYSEYLAFWDVVTFLQYTEGAHIVIYGDSKLATKQMNGEWQIKKGIYGTVAHKVKNLVHQIRLNNQLDIIWVPRDKNKEADLLSKQALKLRKPRIIIE